MSKLIRDLTYKELKKADLLKRVALNEEDFERSKFLREEQNKAHEKWEFLKKLNIALENINVSRET